MLGVEKLISRENKDSIANYLGQLYQSQPSVNRGVFHIVILWQNVQSVMTDVWLYLRLESAETGYTIDCQTFQDLKVIQGNGLTASDGLIMLGKETEREELLRKQNRPIKDYIFGSRPSLPVDINPDQKFYQPD